MYKINPISLSSAFFIPTDVADKHLRMAGKAQLKVLLWLYRNPAAIWDISVISRDTGIPADEIDDSMLYWVEAGVVLKDSEEAPVVPVTESFVPRTVAEKEVQTPHVPEIKEDAPKHSKPVLVKPSLKDIARRMEESDKVRSMYAEAQEIFGRTLGYDVQSSLLIMHDHHGLPVEVILMICNYAKTVGKQGSLSYIMKVGAEWSDLGIDTFEKASEKIARLEKSNRLWTEFKQVTGVENPRPTSKQVQFLEIWVNDYGFGCDMISLSYEKTVEKKGNINFGYMNGILKSWFESGHKTPQDVFDAEAAFAGQKTDKKSKPSTPKASSDDDGPSYDIELALKRSLAIDPTKTKKGQ